MAAAIAAMRSPLPSSTAMPAQHAFLMAACMKLQSEFLSEFLAPFHEGLWIQCEIGAPCLNASIEAASSSKAARNTPSRY